MSPSSTLRSLQQRITQMQPLRLDDNMLPTPPELRTLFPGGALRKGACYSIQGSQQLALSTLSETSASGAWCGIIGYPSLGAEAAAALGIALERCIVIPDPGTTEFWLCSTLSEILTIVLLHPRKRPHQSDVMRISARLREYGTALIVTDVWPHADSSLRVTTSRWHGLGGGVGALENQEITVVAQDRRGITTHVVRYTAGTLARPTINSLHEVAST